MIQPHQIVQVGSPAPGIIEGILVERGDFVRRGQPLVRLNAHVERASLALAREKAGQGGEVRSALGARELALSELERANELFGGQFVSRTYIEKARAEAEVADGRSEQAQERRRLAEREVELAQAQLWQRTIRAPIDGVVVDRYMSPGEYVEQKPVLRLAAIDPLRVDVLVPAAGFGAIKVGAQASVTPEMFGGGTVAASVSTVDRVIDAASNTFRVRLALPNPDGALPAGLRCKVDLGLRLPMPATALPASARSVAPAPAATTAPARAAPARSSNIAAAGTLPSR
jgi:RND family efflux transporter MFP subunit